MNRFPYIFFTILIASFVTFQKTALAFEYGQVLTPPLAATGTPDSDALRIPNEADGKTHPAELTPSAMSSREIANRTADFINGLQLVQTPSGCAESPTGSDKSYRNLVQSIIDAYTQVSTVELSLSRNKSGFLKEQNGADSTAGIIDSINNISSIQIRILEKSEEISGTMNEILKSILAQNALLTKELSNSSKIFN